MASSEHPEADATAPTIAIPRIVTYVCVCLALLVVLWALIEGGDRDLWTQPSALFALVFAVVA